MPAIIPSATDRYYVRYQVGPDVHTLTLRTAPGLTLGGFITWFNSLIQAASPFCYVTTLVDINKSVAGSNVRLPQPSTGATSSWGSGTFSLAQSVYGLAFPGRSAGGHKTRIYFLGVKILGDDNFRYTATENTAVGAVITLLNGTGPDVIVAIDGLRPNWYAYATSKQNDHLVNKRRG